MGVLVGLQSTYHALLSCPGYHQIAALDLPERVSHLRQPEVRARLVAELAAQPVHTFNQLDKLFPLGEFPDYEPSPDASVAADSRPAGDQTPTRPSTTPCWPEMAPNCSMCR